MSDRQSGRDQFDELFKNELSAEVEWQRRNAIHKVESVLGLCRSVGLEPDSVLELGCGSGAVISELKRLGFGSRHIAIDYSATAIDYVRRTHQGVEAIQADIASREFEFSDQIDLIILSHVLEHLEEPISFLKSVSDSLSFNFIVIEVPLEDLPINNFKNHFRDKYDNKAGHVQFFSEKTFRDTVVSSDLAIIDEHLYSPSISLDTVRFVAAKDGISIARRLVMALTASVLPRALPRVWRHLYYGHHAVIASRQSSAGT